MGRLYSKAILGTDIRQVTKAVVEGKGALVIYKETCLEIVHRTFSQVR